MARTSVYALLDGTVDGDLLPAADLNLLSDTLELIGVQGIAELMGAGCFFGADFNASAGAGLAVTMSAGRAWVGGTGQRKLVRLTSPTSVGSLTDSNTNYIYLLQNGTFAKNTTGIPPANSILVATATCAGGVVSSVNNIPTGRVNLAELLALQVTASVAAEAGNAIVVTLQWKDWAGNNVARRMAAHVWLSDTATGVPTSTAPSAGWSATAGQIVKQFTTNIEALVESDATGKVVLSIGEAGAATWYLRVAAGERIYSSGAITFV